MREIRRIYFGEKKRHFRRYLGKVGLAYGLALVVAILSRLLTDPQQESKQAS